MKMRIASIGAIVAVSVATAATAKTNTLTGAFFEDPPSSISMQVALNKHKRPKTLKSITATFTERCTRELGDGDSVTTESVATRSVPGSFKIKLLNDKYRFEGTASDDEGYEYELSGVVDKKGKHGKGNLSVERIIPETETENTTVCNNYIATWKADK